MTDAVSTSLDVSRETFERLQTYVDLLKKWNPKINLVSKISLADVWTRHIQDSLQVAKQSVTGKRWLDIGSGGGLPGIVAAIYHQSETPNRQFVLIESDQRKSAFLRTAIRECGLNATVISKRIEQADPQSAHIISARALADLSTLFELSQRHVVEDGIMLFPKGKTWRNEVEQAQQTWNFDYEAIKSLTEPDAVLLMVKGVSRD